MRSIIPIIKIMNLAKRDLILTLNTREVSIMIEPVALKDFFVTFYSAALIIMAGASYALLFTWSKVNSRLIIKLSAYLSYLVLLVSVYQLSVAANLVGYWQIISYVMVVGYFFAPIAIWHLCHKTHENSTLTTTLEKNNE